MIPSVQWYRTLNRTGLILQQQQRHGYNVVRSLTTTVQATIKTKEKPRLSVCILGPPNAGKSTLFNRLIKKDSLYRLNSSRSTTRLGHRGKSFGRAIVHDTAGTTRDRRYAPAILAGLEFDLWDTAGILNAITSKGDTLSRDMFQHAQHAAAASDLVILLFDARHNGLTSDVLDTAKWLRKLQHENKMEVLFVANKLEGDAWNYEGSPILDTVLDAEQRLGGEIIPISALQGEGLADLAVRFHERSRALYGEQEENDTTRLEGEVQKHPLKLAILGRPNVGKSTLLNALVKENRVVTGPTPGLTRDAISVDWKWNGNAIKIVDTAGIRKSGDGLGDLDALAVQDAIAAMKVADVGVIVLDAGVGKLLHFELAICDAIVKEGRALIVVANKMDLMEFDAEYTHGDFVRQVRDQLEGRYPALRKTPIIGTSSLKGIGVEKLFPVAVEARDRWEQTISTSNLNKWVREVQTTSSSPIKVKYLVQSKGRPPTFIVFVNKKKVPTHYENFLRHHFQDTFQMYGMEVRLLFRTGNNPFVSDKPKRGGFGLGGSEARKKRSLKALQERYHGVTSKEEGRSRPKVTRRRTRRR